MYRYLFDQFINTTVYLAKPPAVRLAGIYSARPATRNGLSAWGKAVSSQLAGGGAGRFCLTLGLVPGDNRRSFRVHFSDSVRARLGVAFVNRREQPNASISGSCSAVWNTSFSTEQLFSVLFSNGPHIFTSGISFPHDMLAAFPNGFWVVGVFFLSKSWRERNFVFFTRGPCTKQLLQRCPTDAAV